MLRVTDIILENEKIIRFNRLKNFKMYLKKIYFKFYPCSKIFSRYLLFILNRYYCITNMIFLEINIILSFCKTIQSNKY